MIIIRPIQQHDYDDLYRIAEESGHGFTSLPVNEALLKKRIDRTEQSFNKTVSEPGSESYLFVMEDTETGQIVGTSGVEAAIGLEDTFYSYHLAKVVHSSRELNVYNRVQTLTLCNDYTGASEICTLFLSKTHRKNRNGRFLSRVRFLFMAEHKERFDETVIAEMRGVSDEDGRSPFWDWLETHFFSMDFPTADYLTGIGNKSFIAELMPKHPVYVNLLSKAAQEVINQVHENTVPALKLLEAEGFCRRDYVDIFDAGPTVECNITNINTITESKRCKVLIGEVKEQNNYIICNTKVSEFVAIQAAVSFKNNSNEVVLSEGTANALQVGNGDWIRLVEN